MNDSDNYGIPHHFDGYLTKEKEDRSLRMMYRIVDMAQDFTQSQSHYQAPPPEFAD